MRKSTTIGVLALQGDFAEHAAALNRLAVSIVEVRLPEHLQQLDGLIIPGGESTTIARLLDEWRLLQPIRDRVRDGLAVWGTCAGAILLAQGADDLDREGLRLMDISVTRNAFGRQVDSFEVDLNVGAFGPPPFHAIFIRAPLISSLGPAVRIVAKLNDGAIVAALQDRVLATSFHPELTSDLRFHELFVSLSQRCGETTPTTKVAAE